MLSMLGDALVAVLREMLMNPLTIPESPGYKALRRGIEAIGEARGKAEGLVIVREARGFGLDDATRARISGCEDVETLNGWIARAVTATSLRAAFNAR